MFSILAIAAFGLIGIFCRFGIDQLLASANETFPVSTFLINIVGSALAGMIFVFGEREIFSPGVQLGLLVGFCGGFTTFSSYSLQTLVMAEQGRWIPALSYWMFSPVIGFLAAMGSVILSRKWI